MHTFWRRWLAGQRCRKGGEGVPGRIRVGRHSRGVVAFGVAGGKGEPAITNQFHDQADHAPVR